MERLDEGPCADLAARLGRPCAMFLSGSTPANVMAGILHRLDALVTSRYHAAVLGMQAGVPFVAVSMDERLDGIAKELGVADNCLCHVTDTELDECIRTALSNIVCNRIVMAEAIHRQVRAYRERLCGMSAFLKDYMGKGLEHGGLKHANGDDAT